MAHVTSRDGTPIAYERFGSGPPVVLVGGAFNDHSTLRPLAEELAGDHTAITYDRRGRGASGDRTPTVAGAVGREVDDIAALLAVVDEPTTLLGYSSGAVLALAAAAAGLAVNHLVLVEPPFTPEGGSPGTPPDLPEQLARLVGEGRDGAAVELFQTRAISMPADVVAQVKASPAWPYLRALAPSLVYDAVVMRAHPWASAFRGSVTVPTLVVHGDGTWPQLRQAAAEAARVLPRAHLRTVAGTDHAIVPDAVAAAVRNFRPSVEVDR